MAKTDTQTRLLDAAMRLFAERGFVGTTIGELEREAGLAPRSGAVYQYFASKEMLLYAALEREMATVNELEAVLEALPAGDLAAQLEALARWNLSSIRRRDALNRFLTLDGERLPRDLRDRLYENLVDRPYSAIAQIIETRLGDARREFDVGALALVFVQSMAGYVAMQSRFGKSWDDVDDDRFVSAWVQAAIAVALQAGVPLLEDVGAEDA